MLAVILFCVHVCKCLPPPDDTPSVPGNNDNKSHYPQNALNGLHIRKTRELGTQSRMQGFYSNQISASQTDKSLQTHVANGDSETGPVATGAPVEKFDQMRVTSKTGHRTDPLLHNGGTTENPIKSYLQRNDYLSSMLLNLDEHTIDIFLKELRGQDTSEPKTAIDGEKDVVNVAANPDLTGNNPEAATHVFNANEVNNKQSMYNPNEAFANFVTQTGSSQIHSGSSAVFNPDAVNRVYSISSNGNSLQQAGFAPGNGGYRFSAYGGVQSQPFDASELNQALFQSQSNRQQQLPVFLRIAAPSQAYAQEHQAEQKEHVKDNGTPLVTNNINSSTLPPNMLYKTTVPPSQKFGFIPGQFVQDLNQNTAGIYQQASAPAFLKNIIIPSGANAFNPNSINAAQNVFNPNSMTWIQRRAIIKHVDNTVNDEYDVLDNDQNDSAELNQTINVTTDALSTIINTTTTFPTTLTTATTTEINATVLSEINESSHESSTIASSGDVTINTQNGFNPNDINANQGQSAFVPGQLGGTYAASPLNSHGSHSQQEAGSQSGSFNTDQQFGINTAGDNGKTADNGISQFNPNIINSLTGTYMSGYNANGSNGFVQGFDSNAISAMFLGNSQVSKSGAMSNSSSNNTANANYYGFGGNEFDPNSAYNGFGVTAYGIGSLGGVGNVAFDPNKVNQMPHPLQPSGNLSENANNIMDYFLGIVSGGKTADQTNGGYSSAYIGAFSPDSVNKAMYDPSAFNQAHINLDPIEMLSKNPGMDKATLLAAASAFDPNKLNNPNTQQAFSPMSMLLTNPGMDKDTLANLKYDPSIYDGRNSNQSRGNFNQSGPENFNPGELMEKMMQNLAAFQPGKGGAQQQNFDPSVMFNVGRDPVQQTSTSAAEPVNGTPAMSLIMTSEQITTPSNPVTTTITLNSKTEPISTASPLTSSTSPMVTNTSASN